MKMNAFACSGGTDVAKHMGILLLGMDSSGCGVLTQHESGEGPASGEPPHEELDASGGVTVHTIVDSDLPNGRFPSLVTRDRKIAGNEPILFGTRLRVALLYAMAEKAGLSVEQIANAYPHLMLEQIKDALAYAYANREEMEKYAARDETQEFVAGRPVVRAYDPDDWPYPPEPDCQKEWDEAEE